MSAAIYIDAERAPTARVDGFNKTIDKSLSDAVDDFRLQQIKILTDQLRGACEGILKRPNCTRLALDAKEYLGRAERMPDL